ncbi:MAG: hypothetical protein DYG98_04235 [Haliscomenobacteraceae bacterium CHB4]|nr:hypothetical protein [Haliscomenobacteraceae bacterium CHB4]
MFSNYLASPFVFLSLYFLYRAWKVNSDYAVWLIPFVLIATLIYIFSPQINWWWYSRRPPKLEAGLTTMLERFSGFYRQLSPDDQQKFRGRIALFRMGTDWEAIAFEEEAVPPDVQLALAAQAVLLTFHRNTFLFEKFEKVIVYPKPFPTPEYPFDHASELYEPDGCLLFSAEQVMQAFANPAQWYNVALHEYARAFVLTHPNEPYPVFTDGNIWEKLQAVSKMPRVHVESVIGIGGVEVLPVAIHHYFTFPGAFREVFPVEAQALEVIFGADARKSMRAENQSFN